MIARISMGLALLGSVVLAQEAKRKPGLWEVSVAQETPGIGIPEDRLAQLSPEQRAQFEAILRARGAQASQPLVRKSCETPETLKNEASFVQSGGNSCKVNTVSSTGSQRVIGISCENPQVKSEGTAVIDTPDAEHFTGTVKMHASSNGNTVNVSQKITGRWLSADCGDVKPRAISK